MVCAFPPIPQTRKADANPSPAAYRFNCAQRAHSNFTENHTTVLAALLISGVKYPRVAAGLGAIWVIGRYLFMKGYSNLDLGRGGKGRYRGMVGWIGQLGLMGLTVYSGLEMVMGW